MTLKYIRNVQKIVKRAMENGWIKANPFKNIKFRMNEVAAVYLDNDELNKLLAKKFDIERLEQIRDIFLFCCFTGMAFIWNKNVSLHYYFK